MLRTKRLLTEEEMNKFLELREVSNIKAAKYMKSLEQELFEVTEKEYDGYNTGTKRSRDIKATED